MRRQRANLWELTSLSSIHRGSEQGRELGTEGGGGRGEMHDSPTMVHKLISYLFCVAALLTPRSPKRSLSVRPERFRHRRKRFYDPPPSPSISRGSEPPIVAIVECRRRGGADATATAGSPPSLVNLSFFPSSVRPRPSVALPSAAAILRPIFTVLSPARHVKLLLPPESTLRSLFGFQFPFWVGMSRCRPDERAAVLPWI